MVLPCLIIPIALSVTVIVIVNNLVLFKLYRLFSLFVPNENFNDDIQANLNVSADIMKMDMFRRLDTASRHQVYRLILTPIFYILITLPLILFAIFHNVQNHAKNNLLIFGVCCTLLISVGNSIIWVFTDTKIYTAWIHLLYTGTIQPTERDEFSISNNSVLNMGGLSNRFSSPSTSK